MERSKKIFLIGFLLVILGLIITGNNLDLFRFNSIIFWSIVLFILGIASLVGYYKNKKTYGLLIIGVVLIILALIISLESMTSLPENLTGAAILWILSIVFIYIHFNRDENWWLIIPGGLIFIFAAIISLEQFQLLDEKYYSFIFFFGTSLIFCYLFLTKEDDNKFKWTKPTAVISVVISLIILIITLYSNFINLIIPLAIIALGGYLIYSNKQQRNNAESIQKNDN